ncbi:unnamed protein product [Closterium sp. Yama58-4]|nr:unnamed protein product [Closterium sp. Yama58-4]
MLHEGMRDVRWMVWCLQRASPRKFVPTGATIPTYSSSSHHAFLPLLFLCSFLLLCAHPAHAAASGAAALPPPTPTKCDMSVGEWRYSKSYPRYVTCPYVRSIFNCRGNGRKDQLYEKQRWVPDKCSLPRFSAKAFLAMMRGKTVGFVGDSLMSNMWESFVCLLYASGVNLKLVQKRYGGYRYVGFYIPTSNTTIVYRFSAYLMQAVTNSTGGRGKHGYNVDLDVIDPALMGGVTNMDVIVLTSGTWWQANVPGRVQSNVYRIKGQQVYLKDLNAHKYSLNVLRNYLGQFSSRLLPYFISLSPSHKWDQSYASKPGVCGSDRPLTPTAAATVLGNSTTTLDYVSAQRAAFSSPNPVRFIDVTAISTARPDGHTGVWGVLGGGGTLADGEADDTKSSSATMPGANGTAMGKPRTTTLSQPDCRHWCLPGVPDSWVDVTAAVWQREPSLLRK